MDCYDPIIRLLERGVREQVFPGAVWAVGDASGVLGWGARGLADPADPGSAMRRETIFDVASLTKIVAVWSVIGALWEEGRLPLDQPLGTFWPEVAGLPLGQVTAHHLLTHTAGVPLRANLKASYGTDPRAVREGVLREALHRPPGEAVEYTDRAALILGFLAEHLTGAPLDRLAASLIWRPLGMTGTRFGPLPDAERARCAPTEFDPGSGAHLKGVAHDFSARLLGGVCGIAGVFSTLDDLARFQRHLLNPAPRAGFGEAWVTQSLRIQTGGLAPRRGLFWHPGPGGDEDVYVHYGFTGTALWVSAKQSRWAVLLTNKLYFGRDREPIAAVRSAFHALVFTGSRSLPRAAPGDQPESRSR
ncbi:serine hydrolase domain-containing protein [Nonomuraea sp. N2-4H]|uniref:serine hydrolase domain-containing protein n=1 Tax=Nonomuraea sp. N2-4H TaxID=3128898 RepID=UPI0032538B92